MYLEFARESLKKGYYDFACFFSEQSVQLMLKAVLYRLFGDFPRIHDLRGLFSALSQKLEKAGMMHAASKVREFVRVRRDALDKLSDAYFEARYGSKVFSKEDGEECVEVAEKVLNLLKEVERCVTSEP